MDYAITIEEVIDAVGDVVPRRKECA